MCVCEVNLLPCQHAVAHKQVNAEEVIASWQLLVFVYHFFPHAAGNVNGTGAFLCRSGLLMLSEVSTGRCYASSF